MPGLSLWLVPPRSSKFYEAVQNLISSLLPTLFPGVKTHDFIPHVTLTSGINASSISKDKLQEWLDNLPLSETVYETTTISLVAIEPGEPFFKKLTLRASKDNLLLQLAAACRAYGVEEGNTARANEWAEKDYSPHLSLMYADIDVKMVANRYAAIEAACQNAFGDLVRTDLDLVTGANIVLVDTTKPVGDWEIVAARKLLGVRWTMDINAVSD